MWFVVALISPAYCQDAPKLNERAPTSTTPLPQIPSAYILEPGDELTVTVMFAQDINGKQFRIDTSGNIDLPFVGTVHAAGKTSKALQAELCNLFSPYFTSPNVTLAVTELTGQTVAVAGAVKNPTTVELKGSKTLLEMIAAAGGFSTDAGPTVTVARQLRWGLLPLAGAHLNTSGTAMVADVESVKLLSGDSAENITVLPRDQITVERAKTIYVWGEVKKPGAFPLVDRNRVSALQAVSMAEGLLSTASARGAIILRPHPDQKAEEIPVNLKEIMARRTADVTLNPDDVLYVPNNKAKTIMLRGVEAAIQAGTGVLIWR